MLPKCDWAATARDGDNRLSKEASLERVAERDKARMTTATKTDGVL